MTPDYVSLYAFRSSIRHFLKAGETALAEANVEPQQHQVLLALKARQLTGEETAICDLADALLLTHHSTVGLVDRMERRGLVERHRHVIDNRRVELWLTQEGEATVRHMAEVHQKQLQLLGPDLIDSLSAILQAVEAAAGAGAGRGQSY